MELDTEFAATFNDAIRDLAERSGIKAKGQVSGSQ